MFDRFERKLSPLWYKITGGQVGTGCGVLSDGKSLYFNGPGKREARTVPLDTTNIRSVISAASHLCISLLFQAWARRCEMLFWWSQPIQEILDWWVNFCSFCSSTSFSGEGKLRLETECNSSTGNTNCWSLWDKGFAVCSRWPSWRCGLETAQKWRACQ